MSRMASGIIVFLLFLETSIFGGQEGGGSTFIVSPQNYRDLSKRITLRESVGLEARGKIPGTDIDAIKSENSFYTDPSRLLILPTDTEGTKTLNTLLKLKEKHF